MTKCVLFVDDDPGILDGMQQVLHNERSGWNISFAASGSEALNRMETLHIDIIITDIDMPVMNGIQLLENVRDLYPGTIRMALSEHSELDLIMKSIGVAHQFLPKPCDPEMLKSVIEQADDSKVFLQNEHLPSLISMLGILPGIPLLFDEISREMESSAPSIKRVGEIISSDPGVVAKVLQLANSAFWDRQRGASNITDAVSYLGVNRVAQLLLAIHAFAEFRPADGSFFIEDLWTHSYSTAIRAKQIAEEYYVSGLVADDAFTAGLLHDIGIVVLASRLPEQYKEVISRATVGQIPLWLAERGSFSATHAEVGGYLLGLWRLPNPIVEAVAYHHNPGVATSPGFTALTAVHAADMLECLVEKGSASQLR